MMFGARFAALTCSARSGWQARTARRARRMRLESPTSPPTLSRAREREPAGECFPLSRWRERVGVRVREAPPHVSYTDNDEHAPHFPHPALMSAERMQALPSIAPSGSSTEVMNSGDGAAWSSSGVPLIGTKGTTKG